MGKLQLTFGPTVPPGAINLAWVSVPEASPQHNAVVADLAATIPANVADYYNEQLVDSGYSIKLGDTGKIVQSTTARAIGQLSSPIRVLPPVQDVTGAWHLRVRDGVFRQVIEVRDTDQGWIRTAFPRAGTRVVAVYSVPEFCLVPKTTAGEFEDYVANDRPTPLNSRAIQLSYRNVSVVSAITVNGTAVSPTDASAVSTDTSTGTITFLKRTISVTDDIRVSYWYKTAELVYRGFYDTDGKFKDLDLNPSYGHTYNGDNDTLHLIGRVTTLYLLPSAAYSYDDALVGDINIKLAKDYDCTSFLRWTSQVLYTTPELPEIDDPAARNVPRGSYGQARYGTHHFTTALPSNESGSDNYSDRTGSVGAISDFPSAAVLARVYVGSTGRVENLNIIDTRSRGGGLPDDPAVRVSILSGDQLLEADSCWDISGWDGAPAMLNGTAVVDIPENILSRRGGKFTEAEVDEIVRKRMPAGVLPIIRYTLKTVTENATVASVTLAQLSRTNIAAVDSVTKAETAVDMSTLVADVAAGTITFPPENTIEAEQTVSVTYRY
jgi:hypothetical protein